MGVALFHNIIDVLETVDLSFDAIGNEIVLGQKMLSIPEDRNMSHTDWLREIVKLAEYAKDISIAHKKLSDSINSKRVLRSAQFNARWTS